jgi:hypothetical protein
MALIDFFILNREALEDRKENIFGSFQGWNPAHDLA